MNALEIAVYALVLAGGTDPFTCKAEADKDRVSCSNGLAADLHEDGVIVFANGVQVHKKKPSGDLLFSNGITSGWGSAGWVKFSTGLSARRMTDGRFRFSNGMECAAEGDSAAICIRRK